MGDDKSAVELATDAVEHPSPVSVLDDSLCRDDAPSPPVKQISHFSGGIVSVFQVCLNRSEI